MKTSFRLRQRAHRRCEQVCMRYRRQIEGTIGGKRMFEQLRASVKLAQTLFAEQLERHGLPAQVLRDLPLLIAVVDRAIAERDRARQFHVFANEAIRDALRSSDDAVVALDT